MKSFIYITIVAVALAALGYQYYAIQQLSSHVDQFEDMEYNINAEIDNYQSYLQKAFKFEGDTIDFFPLLNLDGETVSRLNLENEMILAVVFPASACGVCQEEFLQMLASFYEKFPKEKMIFITDVSSKNEVISYLSGVEIGVYNLYLKNEKFVEELEKSGNPYLFILNTQISKNKAIMRNLFIPFNKNPMLERAYLNMALSKLK